MKETVKNLEREKRTKTKMEGKTEKEREKG
jgi:hypothetical protein